jgi:biopolymer transport protein ExbB/TolQ
MRPGCVFLRRVYVRAASWAPIPGIVGTASGIRRAFHGIDDSGQAASVVVSGAILEALVTTLISVLLILPLAAVWEGLDQGPR